MNIAVGVRVVRGPDWSWEDQDGGEGNVGTVGKVKELTADAKVSVLCGTTVIVCWDVGALGNYRCGFDGKFDVRVYDNAQTGETRVRGESAVFPMFVLYGVVWTSLAGPDHTYCLL